MARARGVNLKKLSDVRRFMGQIINQLHKDEIGESKGRTLAYMCGILRDVIKDSDLESRITELESKMKENQNEKY